jgi:chemotaxis protein MotB
MRNDQEQVIVVRKRRGGGHKKSGGAWKVAFADFTLAMMALFMVLWVLAVSSQQEREILATRLRDYSILSNEANPFDISNSPFPVDMEGKPSIEDQMALQYVTDGQPQQPNELYHQANGKQLSQAVEGETAKGYLDTPAQMQQLGSIISRIAKEAHLQNNLKLEVVAQGLRIQIRDDDNSQMYARGSAFITPYFSQVLNSLTPLLSGVQNKLMISGHTDSVPYPDDHYTNWELSSERAAMARRVMVSRGLPTDHVAMVMGLADTMLIDPKHPDASLNRRIEILLMNKKAEQALSHLFSQPVTAASLAAPFQPPLARPDNNGR